MDRVQQLKQHLANLLDAEGAHIGFDEALKNFPRELRGAKLKGAAHTAWQLLEHLRITQSDILEFSLSLIHI